MSKTKGFLLAVAAAAMAFTPILAHGQDNPPNAGLNDGLYKIRSAAGSYLVVSGSVPSTLQDDPKDGSTIWYLKNVEGGVSIPKGAADARMLFLNANRETEGRIVRYVNENGSTASIWHIEQNTDNSFVIRPSEGSVMAITDNGTDTLRIHTYQEELNTQQWLFEQISDAAATPNFGSGLYQINKTALNTEYDVAKAVDDGNDYLGTLRQDLISIITYVGDDGSITICSPDSVTQTAYIYEYSSDMQLIKRLSFNYEFRKFGSFTKDKEGNYYAFYAKDTEESEKDTESMAVVKYNSAGEKIKAYKLNAAIDNHGVAIPFRSGASRMEISGDMLVVYSARATHTGHQVSFGFVLNKNNLERITNMNTNWKSHTFNQYILPIENGFVLADQWEANNADDDIAKGCFYFTKVQAGKNNKTLESFQFKRGPNRNPTFAQMGGLAKTPSGYIFAGTREKNEVVEHITHNDSRNLFVFTFDENLTSVNESEPTWITNYEDKEYNAAAPKIASLATGHFLLMWEKMTPNAYITTFMRIIDGNGNPASEQIELPNVRLNLNDVLRYNRATGNVYWAVNNGSREIVLYSLNVHGQLTPIVKPIAKSGFGIVLNGNSLHIVGATQATPIRIYNLRGNVVMSRTVAPNESVSVQHLPKGVYVVKAGGKTVKVVR